LVDFRGFLHGVEEILILSLGLVRSMAEMTSKVLLLRWKGKRRRKLKDMQKFLKKDTKS
jgi:hypothetical protein